jgi:membrane peptidoglycan carboxypeptidase
VLALFLELKYPKETILESYLNAVYFGQRGGVPIRGVEEASRFYFGVGIERLTLPQAALLAALIRGPNLYSPFHAGVGCVVLWGVVGRLGRAAEVTCDRYRRKCWKTLP